MFILELFSNRSTFLCIHEEQFLILDNVIENKHQLQEKEEPNEHNYRRLEKVSSFFYQGNLIVLVLNIRWTTGLGEINILVKDLDVKVTFFRRILFK